MESFTLSIVSKLFTRKIIEKVGNRFIHNILGYRNSFQYNFHENLLVIVTSCKMNAANIESKVNRIKIPKSNK